MKLGRLSPVSMEQGAVYNTINNILLIKKIKAFFRTTNGIITVSSDIVANKECLYKLQIINIITLQSKVYK